jgi:TonB family protein
MSSKKAWIISLSVATHVVVFTVAYVTNAWRLDRLDAEKASISLAVMMPPPAPSGGPAPGQKPKDPAPVKTVVKEPTQPMVATHKDEPKAVDDTTGGGIGDTHGPGTNPDGDPADPGTCVGPACGPSTAPPVHEDPPVVIVEKKQLITVPPQILKGLRISGETLIAPPDVVKTQMMRDDHKRSIGAFKLCLSETGDVTSVSVVASTKYAAYDAKLMATMRTWKYHPYMAGGTPMAVCSAISFIYSME